MGNFDDVKNPPAQRTLEHDPEAEKFFWGAQKAALAAYEEPLDRLHLDGYVYPAIQMPPNDETIPQPDGGRSSGPHSQTAWVNPLGVPAIVLLQNDASRRYAPRAEQDRVLVRPTTAEAVAAVVSHPAWAALAPSGAQTGSE